MPPRYAYWTILIDSKPTAFRATRQEELLPTLTQLQRTNANVVMKWFARGKIWENPEQAQWAGRNINPLQEKRGSGWRPGGTHEDPRTRFDRKKRDKRGAPTPAGDRPWSGKPRHDPRGDSRSSQNDDTKRDFSPAPKPDFSGDRRPRPPFKRPFESRPPAAGSNKPFEKGTGRKPYGARPQEQRSGKPSGAPPRRPFTGAPQGKSFGGGQARSDRPDGKPFRDRPPAKPYGGQPPGQSFRDRPQSTTGADRNRPWTPGARPAKPGNRPWSAKPGGGDARRWANKPPATGDAPPSSRKPAFTGGARPWGAKPSGRPDHPPFKQDARRPAPKTIGKPAPRADSTDRKRDRTDDET